MDRLPWDVSRCEGVGCDRKDMCLRYVALRDVGPRTPVGGFLCGWGEGFLDHFVPVEPDADADADAS